MMAVMQATICTSRTAASDGGTTISYDTAPAAAIPTMEGITIEMDLVLWRKNRIGFPLSKKLKKNGLKAEKQQGKTTQHRQT